MIFRVFFIFLLLLLLCKGLSSIFPKFGLKLFNRFRFEKCCSFFHAIYFSVGKNKLLVQFGSSFELVFIYFSFWSVDECNWFRIGYVSFDFNLVEFNHLFKFCAHKYNFGSLTHQINESMLVCLFWKWKNEKIQPKLKKNRIINKTKRKQRLNVRKWAADRRITLLEHCLWHNLCLNDLCSSCSWWHYNTHRLLRHCSVVPGKWTE